MTNLHKTYTTRHCKRKRETEQYRKVPFYLEFEPPHIYLI